MDNKYSTSLDVTLVNKALKQRWPIPDNERPIIIRDIISIIKNPETNTDLKLKAANTLQRFDGLNIKHEENNSIGLSIKLEDMTDAELEAYINAAGNALSEGGGTSGIIETQATSDKSIPAG